MGRHSMLGETTGRHAVPVITDLRERLSDPSLSLCPHGRACPLYAGNAPRHAVSLHTRPVTDPEAWVWE